MKNRIIFNRVFSLILVFVLCMASSSFLFSCSGETPDSNDNDGNNKISETSDSLNQVSDNITDTANSPEIISELPDITYNGYKFKILGNSKEYHEDWWSYDLYAEEETGDTINDAIYARNRSVEEKFDIEIAVYYSSNPAGDARKNILAGGSDMYDLLSIQLEGTAQVLAQGGFLTDLNNLPYIDLDKPWWDQKAREQLSIGNKLFMVESDITTVDKDAVFAYLFNKDLIQDLNLDNPYQLVKTNKWTVDILYNMIKAGTHDINGDGTIDDTDRYGNLAESNTFYESILSSDELFIDKDSDGMPVAALNKSRLIQAFDKWLEIYNDKENTMIAQEWNSKYPGNEIWDYQLKMLNEKRALFLHTSMSRVSMLRQMECNFGVLPMPKLSETQAEYSNGVHPWCATVLSIPNASSDLNRTAVIVEALANKSYYTLRPAYYDISLKNKLIRDDESGEMLDLIFSTRTYDLGHIFNWGSLFNAVSNLVIKKSSDYTSTMEANSVKINTAIEKTIAAFEEIN